MLAYPSSKLKFCRAVFFSGIVLGTAIGLQSCNLLQSNNKKSDKPAAQSDSTVTQPTISSPLPKALPTAALGKRGNLGQSMSASAGQAGAIDPVTGLPIPVKGGGTIDPTTGLPIPVKGTNPLTGQPSADTLSGLTTMPTGTTSTTTVPLPKTSSIDASSSSLSRSTTSTKTTPPRDKAKAPLARAKEPDASTMYRVPSNGLPSLKPSTSDGFVSGSLSTGSSASSTQSRTSTFDNATGTATAGTFPNSAGAPTTAESSAPGNSGQSSSSSGYVYDPATAAYKPASSLPVWNPSANSNSGASTPAASPSSP